MWVKITGAQSHLALYNVVRRRCLSNPFLTPIAMNKNVTCNLKYNFILFVLHRNYSISTHSTCAKLKGEILGKEIVVVVFKRTKENEMREWTIHRRLLTFSCHVLHKSLNFVISCFCFGTVKKTRQNLKSSCRAIAFLLILILSFWGIVVALAVVVP